MAREAVVDEDDFATHRADDDVRWLDIPMRHASRMRRGNPIRNLHRHPQQFTQPQSLRRQQLFQSLPVDPLHHQEVDALVLAILLEQQKEIRRLKAENAAAGKTMSLIPILRRVV